MPRAAAAKGRTDYPQMLDARWRQATENPVVQQFVAPVVISKPDTIGEYDETTHSRPKVAGAVVYEGMGRLIGFGTGSSPESAGQTVTLRRYRLSIPFPGVPLQPGYKVRFQSGDPILDARVLTISAEQLASVRLQTDYLLEDDQG